LQGLEVSYDIVIEDSRVFGSAPGTANQQMKITLDQSTSLPLIAQEDDYKLGFTFYYSATQSMRNAEKLVHDNALCSKVHVVKVPVLCFRVRNSKKCPHFAIL